VYRRSEIKKNNKITFTTVKKYDNWLEGTPKYCNKFFSISPPRRIACTVNFSWGDSSVYPRNGIGYEIKGKLKNT